MEQVLPGADSDSDSDPIIESNELKDGGDPGNALKILMKLCEADLRCLDAHAHLGNFVFQHRPAKAIRHYEVGLRIGELSLGDAFDGVLPWGLIDNRPFLRACITWGCVAGVSVASTRRHASSTGCCGSTRPTTRARVF